MPIFNPPLLLILLVGLFRWGVVPWFLTLLQVFRIIAPYIMLSVTFASLNYTLGLPPHSLLLIALSMADGTSNFIFPLNTVLMFMPFSLSDDARILPQRERHRRMVGDRPICGLLLHFVSSVDLVSWYLRRRCPFDGGCSFIPQRLAFNAENEVDAQHYSNISSIWFTAGR